ncbi:MAG: LacI family DNA-binding transcriptional regulator [Planctomycetota bacterium]
MIENQTTTEVFAPSRRRLPVSVRELARRVGVSTATVSRALNNQPQVSPETRAKVLAAADETGYQFRVGKRFTNVIGLVYPNAPVHPDEGSFEAAMISGILRGIDEQRFDLQFVNIDRDRAEGESISQLFRRKGLRGVIIRSVRSTPNLAEEISDDGFPSILIADHSDHPNVNCIRSESGQSSAIAVDHLAQLGHKRIAYVGHIIVDADHRDRDRGFRAGMARNGLEIDEELILSTPGTSAGGTVAIDRMLALPDPPTAMYFTTPPATLGALQRCLQLGIRVPTDLSIVGFDDSTTRLRSFPNYAAVCQDAAQLGLEAARWLTRSLEGIADERFQVMRPTTFEPGRSTCVAPATPTRLLPTGRVARGGGASSEHGFGVE